MEEAVSWKEQKKGYTTLAIGFLVIFVIPFVSGPNPTLEKLERIDNLVLKTEPIYISTKGKHKTHYIRFIFNGISNEFELSGKDYQYANHELLKRHLNIGDTVTIYIKNGEIYSLAEDGFDYCDLNEANIARSENRILTSIFSSVGFIICMITVSFKEEPKVHPTLILVLSLILISILLSYFVGCESTINKDYS